MSDTPDASPAPGSPLHVALLIAGGLSLGTGILFLIDSFGWAGGEFNKDFAQIGFSGLDDISLLPASQISFPLIVIGAICLIVANATAWKQTDGY
ncbi:MAG: hypothetical protein H6732_09290 [Alphaproteobacteria bacterium]|nr:hypothetical protein [Alphaproteobacteria bacterium]